MIESNSMRWSGLDDFAPRGPQRGGWRWSDDHGRGCLSRHIGVQVVAHQTAHRVGCVQQATQSAMPR